MEESMSEEWHLTAEVFRRCVAQRVSPAQRRHGVRHLLAQCPQCLQLASRLSAETGYWFPKGTGVPAGARDYEKSFQAAFRFTGRGDRRFPVERLRGWGQWSALEPLQADERLPMVIAHPEYQHWGLYRALLDAARWYGFRAPKGTVNIVQLALDVAELLDPQQAGGELEAIDLRAQGFAILGNTRRL